MKPITINLPDEVLTKVDEICKKWNIPRSELVREVLVHYLEQSGREGVIYQELDTIKRKLDTIEQLARK